MPPQEKYDLGCDEGYVEITIAGATLTVCPSEELDAIHKKLTPDQMEGQAFLQVVREYIAERTKATSEEKRVSSTMARRFYETLLQAEKDVMDFFGYTQSSDITSDSNPADGASEKSEVGSQTSPDSSLPTPSE